MAGGVLALDMSSRLGFALARLPARPLTPLEMATIRPKQPMSGVVKFSGEVGPFLANFERWLNQMLDEHQPAGIAFESPILPTITTPQTVMKLMGLASVLLMTCHKRRIGWVRQAQPATVKKFISGHGGKGKERVMAAIDSFGWRYQTDDEADALALWCFAADLYAVERAKARAA